MVQGDNATEPYADPLSPDEAQAPYTAAQHAAAQRGATALIHGRAAR